jgi:hypothetical protein
VFFFLVAPPPPPPPPPEGASNLQPVFCHAIIVSDQNWLTGECLCD